jgi:transcriptional regulator with XRE-family HTH domain
MSTIAYKGNSALPRPTRKGGRESLTADVIAARAAEYRRLRDALGISRAELSALTGLAVSTLNQMPYEPVGRVPSPEVLERMREELARRQREGIAPPRRRRKDPEAAAADRERRRDEYVGLRRRLAMSPAALARLVGLSVGTVRLYPARTSPDTAPTDATLAKMRQELVRRARQTLAEAEWRAEIEQDIAELEARWHVRRCAEEAGPLEDAA